MDYNEIKEMYLKYLSVCRKTITSSTYTMQDAQYLNLAITSLPELNQIITNHRLKMIDQKDAHTMRMINEITKINRILELEPNLSTLTKLAILFHDIGRFSQATWSNTFNDVIYHDLGLPYDNHGQEGAYIFQNYDFHISKKYIPIISTSIYYHPNHYLNPKLNYQYTSPLQSINTFDIITGNSKLNEEEWHLASLITQLVADIDKADILYQLVTGDIPITKPHITDKSHDTIESISKYWGVSPESILEYNHLTPATYSHKSIFIPVENMPLEKLTVPKELQDMFYHNTYPPIDELKKNRSWHFISILWWRLSHFLNQICFTANLMSISESDLISKIYMMIPPIYYPLVDSAFTYAKEELIDNTIKKSQGKVYLKRK